jgi:hypothetical protein
MVEEHLREVFSDYQRDWDERLPIFLLAYRASTHETTGAMPIGMVFGGSYVCPVTCFSGSPPTRSRLLPAMWWAL